MPSGPRRCSTKSRTSRPRSPTRRDHVDVGVGIRAIMPISAALADAGAGENAKALTLAARQAAVQRADARLQRLLNTRPG